MGVFESPKRGQATWAGIASSTPSKWTCSRFHGENGPSPLGNDDDFVDQSRCREISPGEHARAGARFRPGRTVKQKMAGPRARWVATARARATGSHSTSRCMATNMYATEQGNTRRRCVVAVTAGPFYHVSPVLDEAAEKRVGGNMLLLLHPEPKSEARHPALRV